MQCNASHAVLPLTLLIVRSHIYFVFIGHSARLQLQRLPISRNVTGVEHHTVAVRHRGLFFPGVPCGNAGLGIGEIVQQWVRNRTHGPNPPWRLFLRRNRTRRPQMTRLACAKAQEPSNVH
ncbi:hypothetical protein BO78DRAFT_38918 [Aspergillus sclerotiicarbonarius CBS 121057]|uniref:Uncharacterized protein n=1 Tax=Aspergillus sclerotiicarbonarius (strain CBS 121057 / IBT 28362) TaxID=1448318 RepID=A0A319EXJ2_ASPSB|nr:hypothetical protein BO78DRAFT_38918 [Aspergillus sclerotiicarbonarius CBS 121057]